MGEAWIDIKKLRNDRGWFQEETAEKLGITRAYLSAVENGKRGISLNVMEAVIRVFGVKYEDFYKKRCISGTQSTNQSKPVPPYTERRTFKK